MWDCGWLPGLGWGGGLWGGGGLIYLLIWGAIIIALVLLAIKFGRYLFSHNGSRIDRDHSLQILNMRYASGELSHEEYNRIKKALSP